MRALYAAIGASVLAIVLSVYSIVRAVAEIRGLR